MRRGRRVATDRGGNAVTVPRALCAEHARGGLADGDLHDRGLADAVAVEGDGLALMVVARDDMRPLPGWSRYQTPIQGLYLGGSGAHPGRTIAGGSGRLAAQAMLNR